MLQLHQANRGALASRRWRTAAVALAQAIVAADRSPMPSSSSARPCIGRRRRGVSITRRGNRSDPEPDLAPRAAPPADQAAANVARRGVRTAMTAGFLQGPCGPVAAADTGQLQGVARPERAGQRLEHLHDSRPLDPTDEAPELAVALDLEPRGRPLEGGRLVAAEPAPGAVAAARPDEVTIEFTLRPGQFFDGRDNTNGHKGDLMMFLLCSPLTRDGCQESRGPNARSRHPRATATANG